MNNMLFAHGIGAGGGSNIKSIQSGSVLPSASTLTTTVTISAIDITKSLLYYNTAVYGAEPDSEMAQAIITNSTTLTFTYSVVPSTGTRKNFNWSVIEFNNVKSKQSGTIANTTGNMNIPISSVNVAKSIVVCTFKDSYSSSTASRYIMGYCLSSPTTIAISTSSTTQTIAWQVIEFN